jgi:glutamyl-tRNA synthetase
MKVPEEGECVIHDLLRGEVVSPWNTVDDQVLMKSDNFPTYHLANVVDDHLMGITHVVRGEEWINSCPKHKLLYEYFGWEPPVFCHLPLLRNPDKSKLSKRKNPTSILYYRQAGILPEALLNYLGLMGYTPPNGEEMFTVAEMVESFDIGRVSLGGPIFDIVKMNWLNGRYLREKCDTVDLLGRLKEWMLNDATWEQILPLVQKRLEKLSDLVPMTAFFSPTGSNTIHSCCWGRTRTANRWRGCCASPSGRWKRSGSGTLRTPRGAFRTSRRRKG